MEHEQLALDLVNILWETESVSKTARIEFHSIYQIIQTYGAIGTLPEQWSIDTDFPLPVQYIAAYLTWPKASARIYNLNDKRVFMRLAIIHSLIYMWSSLQIVCLGVTCFNQQ
jgi:hypothetical protein